MTGTRRRSQPRVTDAHRRDLLNLLSFGAMPFRAICVRYAEELGKRGPVDRGMVRRTLDSCIGRGEVMAIRTRRPGQHPYKHERAPMTVYAVADPVRLRFDAAAVRTLRARQRSITEDERLLALLCVAADLKGDGRTVLTCSSDEQAKRIFAEAKRLLGSPASWAQP